MSSKRNTKKAAPDAVSVPADDAATGLRLSARGLQILNGKRVVVLIDVIVHQYHFSPNATFQQPVVVAVEVRIGRARAGRPAPRAAVRRG